MNIGAMAQAMREKELIDLVSELVKFREKHGKQAFKDVVDQMSQFLILHEEIKKND